MNVPYLSQIETRSLISLENKTACKNRFPLNLASAERYSGECSDNEGCSDDGINKKKKRVTAGEVET